MRESHDYFKVKQAKTAAAGCPTESTERALFLRVSHMLTFTDVDPHSLVSHNRGHCIYLDSHCARKHHCAEYVLYILRLSFNHFAFIASS